MSVDESSPNVKPEIVFIYELIEQIGEGTLRVPRFQRPFVWRRDQMRDLLDSVWRRYPIGSLLVWDASQQMSSFDAIGPIAVPDQATAETSFVLDGHQRLSTLFGTLMNWETVEDSRRGRDTDDPERWRIWYDAISNNFVHLDRSKTSPQPSHFPMWKLLDTFAFLKECQRVMLEGGSAAQGYVDKFQQLSEIIRSYKLPVIRIRSTDLRQAVEIFSRLNAKGQRMTADQIVSALAYEEADGGKSFNLAEDIDGLLTNLKSWGFGEVDRAIVLRALLAALGEDIYRTDWTRIFQEKQNLRDRLPEVVKLTRRSLKKTVGFLRKLGVYNSRLLPYSMQIVVLSAFFKERPDPTLEQLALLRRWFWVSSFTGWFASGNPSRIRSLIEELTTVTAQDDEANDLREMRLDTPAQPFPENFDARSARVRTFLLVLLSQNPLDLKGQALAEPWQLIEYHGPEAVSQIISYWPGEKSTWSELRSSPANRILNVPEADEPPNSMRLRRGQAKNWLKTLPKQDLDKDKLEEVLLSHAIELRAFRQLAQGHDHQFLEMRLEYLMQLDIDFMKEKGVTEPVEKEPAPAPVDSEDG